jgi:putative ABC transport system ATP-binding protein
VPSLTSQFPPIADGPPFIAGEPPRDPLFVARGLTKVYHTGEVDVRALDGVDLALYPSELIVLLGASGSGKSTLLNILGGLDVPTSGTLSYRGRDIASADEAELTRFRRDSVGFIFQFYNLIPSLTGRENVALITDIARDPMPPEEALALVDLTDRMDHFPSQMSGGQQQRVAIARAIAKRPEVLLCDEPTGALDVKTGITVLEAIEHVNLELGTLTVVITHNAVIAEMADRVIHLRDGRIAHITENQSRRPVRELEW